VTRMSESAPLLAGGQPMAPANLLQLKITDRQQEAEDICRLELRHPDGLDLPAFSAGAHIDLHLPSGLIRPYSLCGSPTQRSHYEIAVLREPDSRGGSRLVHEEIHVGSMVTVAGPRNHFELAPATLQVPHSVLVAGGIGITPLLSMADTLSRQGASFELHCAARSAARAAFTTRLANSAFATQVHWHLGDGPDPQRLDLKTLLSRAPRDSHLYVCGPVGLIDASRQLAQQLGWSEDQVHFELFGAQPVVRELETVSEFKVVLARTGQEIIVTPDQTIAEALALVGVHIPVSCGQGVCGTCLTRVVDGHPDHLDMFLTSEEQRRNDQILPCCSRSKSATLTLDL